MKRKQKIIKHISCFLSIPLFFSFPAHAFHQLFLRPLLNWCLLSRNSMYWDNVTPWILFSPLSSFPLAFVFPFSFYVFVLWNHDLQLYFIFIPFLYSLALFSFLFSRSLFSISFSWEKKKVSRLLRLKINFNHLFDTYPKLSSLSFPPSTNTWYCTRNKHPQSALVLYSITIINTNSLL